MLTNYYITFQICFKIEQLKIAKVSLTGEAYLLDKYFREIVNEDLITVRKVGTRSTHSVRVTV